MKKIGILISLLFISAFSQANEISGKIHTIHANIGTNLVHIYLEGKPTFDGGGCTNYWTANSMDDEKFRLYILPLLMTAHAKEEAVRVVVNGCEGSFPSISQIDYAPRQ